MLLQWAQYQVNFVLLFDLVDIIVMILVKHSLMINKMLLIIFNFMKTSLLVDSLAIIHQLQGEFKSLTIDFGEPFLEFTIFAGVKATYLLAVAFLEIIRFSSNGGILNGGPSLTASRSAFSCVFEYLKTPSLMPAVFQCLTALVHRAFETAVSWLVFFLLFFIL